jgi:hypothetical protein
MADYTRTKAAPGRPDPEAAVDSSFSRYGPLITGQQVKDKFLYGIKLKSPETGQEMAVDMIDDHIQDAIAEIEDECHISIFPTQLQERQAFDKHLWQALGYFKLRHRPVASVEDLSIVTSNDVKLWTISNDWIDKGMMAKGQLYVLPLNVASVPQAAGTSGGPAGGAVFLALLGGANWVGAYWTCTYTVGFRDGEFPRNINTLIGCVAAINILAQLAQANARNSSKSLGIDGLSQSSSNPGPAVYDQAIVALEKRRALLVRKCKNTYGMTLFTGEV